MVTKVLTSLAELYDTDETAWLEAMSELIAEGQLADLDLGHLMEFLSDMARRDRREVSSRLAILIAHVLKGTFQTDRRSASWRHKVVVQRQELARLLESGSPRGRWSN